MELGHRYDAIAATWDEVGATSEYGVPFLRRAIGFASESGKALDVGCGSGGRVINELQHAGFAVLGVDVSAAMLKIAAQRHPGVPFVRADICSWSPPDVYALIVAWDSVFHVPYSEQGAVIQKLCRALAPGGVLLFTAGGRDGEITGKMHGQVFYYSSLGDEDYLSIINAAGCRCILLERDQYPEDHLVVIAVRSQNSRRF